MTEPRGMDHYTTTTGEHYVMVEGQMIACQPEWWSTNAPGYWTELVVTRDAGVVIKRRWWNRLLAFLDRRAVASEKGETT